VIDAIAFLAMLATSIDGGSSGLAPIIVAAVVLLLIAVGGVLLAIRARSYALKGLGIGLAVGWALLTIVSSGACTGVSIVVAGL
jgi:hypothetical protein